MRSTMLLGAALLLGAAVQGCARAQARVPAEMPPLEMPTVPPREIASIEEPEPAPPQPERPASSEPADRSTPRTTRMPPARPGSPRVEAPPPKPEPAEAPPEPTLQLRTQRGANDQETDRQIRQIIGQASQALSRVDYAALNDDARAQYDTAKRFIEQTTEALKVQNYVFALYLADKAETIARQLSGR